MRSTASTPSGSKALNGISASFPYIVEALLRTRQAGVINPARGDLSDLVDVPVQERALDVLPSRLSHIKRHRICK